MSEPPVKGPELDGDGDVAFDVDVVEEVRIVPPVAPVQARVPPRPVMRSVPPRPTPKADAAAPIVAMPVITLGTPSADGDIVEVGSSGVRRSSLPPPPIRPGLAEIEEEVTPLRTRAPADSLVQAIPEPRAPLQSDPRLERPAGGNGAVVTAQSASDELDDGIPVDEAFDSERSPKALKEPSSAAEILPDEIVDSAPASERAAAPAASEFETATITEVESEVAGADGAPDNRLSEPPPEVDPADLEIHEIERPAGAPAKQPPPARLPLPLPLYARGAELAAAVQAQQAEVPTTKRARYWWDEMFGDDFLRTMDRLTDEQVRKEANFIEESLGVQKNGIILDLACGAGRHAVELAVRGYNVVGYDLSLAMLARAADEAQARDQKLNFLHGDMRDMGFEEMFDGVFCWSTSFGYFDDEKNQLVAQKIHRALRKGGMLLLDLANRDFVAQRQPSLVWFEGESCICMDEMRVDFITSRLRVKRMVILEDGRTRELDYSIRLYTLHELGRMLHDVGFKVTEVSGHPATPGVFMGADSPRLIVLAEKA